MLRRLADGDETILRYAAVLGIVGSLDIPLLIVAIRIWRGIHPAVMISDDPDAGIKDPLMVWTFLVSMVALGLLFTWLVWLRLRYERIDERLAALHAERAHA
jgi:heme exporter protein C